ncbi:MAG TPA: hypothetical protein VLC30_03315 [Pseudomonas sp.]|nr:hypothetical protein [Pseudomonas sp.]
MARFIRKQAHSGALAGVGLYGIAASIVLVLSLGLSHGQAHTGSPGAELPQGLRSLLAGIRVGG